MMKSPTLEAKKRWSEVKYLSLQPLQAPELNIYLCSKTAEHSCPFLYSFSTIEKYDA
jgi:hypothetical protein